MRIVHFILGRCNPDSANGVDKTAYYLSKTQTSMGHQVSLAAGDSESPPLGSKCRTLTKSRPILHQHLSLCPPVGEQVQELIPDRELQQFLEALNGSLVLRNHDFRASLVQGGDVDVLVSDRNSAEELLFRYLGPPLWKASQSYLCGYFYPWGQIDLWNSLEWRGAVFVSVGSVLKQSESSHFGFARPRLAHEALVSWFTCLLWTGVSEDRYEGVIVDAAQKDGVAFRQALIHAVGPFWGERLWHVASEGRPGSAARWVRALRRMVFFHALLREPSKTLRGCFRFWKRSVSFRLRPPLPWLAVLGSDGSGKSTILEMLNARHPHGFGFKGVRVFHWRPGVVRPSRGTGPVTNPHGQHTHGCLISIAKLAFFLFDWLLGYWTHLVHLRAKGYLVAFDRHYLDILVDPVRYRYGGPTWLARLVARLVPKPDLVIFLEAPVELLRSRKQEVPAEEVGRQRKAYLDLVLGLRNGHVVDASKPVSGVVGQVEKIIFDWMARRAPRFEGVKKVGG